MHELVAEHLVSGKTYAIVILYAEDPDDMEMMAEIECLQATMQVKIANSDSEYRCIKKGLDDWKTKLENQATSIDLSYKTLVDKGKHLNMVAY